MSKRQEIRSRRQKEKGRNRLFVILLVAAGALLIVFALILPSINKTKSNNANSASVQVTPITPRTFNSKVDGVHLGDPNAKVKIDVWEDFQCSSCLNFSKTIEPQVLQNLVDTGKVYYTFHFFPFIETFSTPPTQESHQAANAAMCASAQGRFWDYHDILFANWLGENVGSYTDARLVAMAQSLNLNMTDFNACFQADTYKSQINQDFSDGQAKGITGTPSVFVNGTILTPGYIPTYDQIAQAVATAEAGH